MESEQVPQPESRGALVPPDRHPPTAIGVDTPEPPRPPRRARHVHVERHVHVGPDLRKAMSAMLDTLDRAAEIVAVELGLRLPR